MVIVRQGGLAFLLIYAILVALLGAPLLLLELALGQYSALPTARYVGNIENIQNWKIFKISIVSGCIATSAHYCLVLALRSQCLHLLEVGILGAFCMFVFLRHPRPSCPHVVRPQLVPPVLLPEDRAGVLQQGHP